MMPEAVIVALITGSLGLVGTIIVNNRNHRDFSASLEKSQAVTETKLDDLTREVRRHNGFAERIPELEGEVKLLSEKIDVANHRIKDLELRKD